MLKGLAMQLPETARTSLLSHGGGHGTKALALPCLKLKGGINNAAPKEIQDGFPPTWHKILFF